MSAGVCGKRLGIEDIFGGSTAPAPAAKRSRCGSPYGSPVRSGDYGFGGAEDRLAILLRMFPSVDRKVVESVLNSHDHKIDDAIKSLQSLCVGGDSVTSEAATLSSEVMSNDNVSEEKEKKKKMPCTSLQTFLCPRITGSMNPPASETNAGRMQDGNLNLNSGVPQNGSSWVDLFVQEMMHASDWEDVRGRATKFLEAFEKSVLAHPFASEQEIASLKEQLQSLLRDNQILKRAVAIQHERNLEHEEKLKEVQQLKHIISQYQEQLRTLELSNYSLKIHLQRAQESSSIPSHFHPDIF